MKAYGLATLATLLRREKGKSRAEPAPQPRRAVWTILKTRNRLYATRRSACDTAPGGAPPSLQPPRPQTTVTHVRTTPGPSAQEVPPGVVSAPALPGTPGRSRYRPTG